MNRFVEFRTRDGATEELLSQVSVMYDEQLPKSFLDIKDVEIAKRAQYTVWE